VGAINHKLSQRISFLVCRLRLWNFNLVFIKASQSTSSAVLGRKVSFFSGSGGKCEILSSCFPRNQSSEVFNIQIMFIGLAKGKEKSVLGVGFDKSKFFMSFQCIQIAFASAFGGEILFARVPP
jgi:hypothetical protein